MSTTVFFSIAPIIIVVVFFKQVSSKCFLQLALLLSHVSLAPSRCTCVCVCERLQHTHTYTPNTALPPLISSVIVPGLSCRTRTIVHTRAHHHRQCTFRLSSLVFSRVPLPSAAAAPAFAAIRGDAAAYLRCLHLSRRPTCGSGDDEVERAARGHRLVSEPPLSPPPPPRP